MASQDHSPPKFPTPQSIPLQDLSRPPDNDESQTSRNGRPSIRSPRRSAFARGHGSRYELLEEGSPSPPYRSEGDRPRLTTSSLQVSPYRTNDEPHSPIDDLPTFAAATSSLGLSFGPSEPSRLSHEKTKKEPIGPAINVIATNDSFSREVRQPSFELEDQLPPADADTTPLTGGEHLHPSKRENTNTPTGQRHDRQSKRRSVHWTDGESLGPSPQRSRISRLGDDLPTLEEGQGLHRMGSTTDRISRLTSASGGGRSRSQSPSASVSPIARANSMLRMMSQRVVNLSNDTEIVEQSIRRKTSVRLSRLDGPPSLPATVSDADDDSIEAAVRAKSPTGKLTPAIETHVSNGPIAHPNPLRGKALGVFGADNRIRKGLCETLVHPVTEPLILILIVIQTVLLAVDSAQSVYNDPRSKMWGTARTDYALLALFVLYTLEIVARTIVSGFILNPTEYSTLDRSLGLRKAMVDQGRSLFAPQRQRSIKKQLPHLPSPP